MWGYNSMPLHECTKHLNGRTLISCGAFVPLAVKWPLQTRRVSRITSNIIHSACLVGKGRLKERCGLEARTNFFSFKKLAKIRCGLDSRIYGILFKLKVPATNLLQDV